MKDVTSLFDDYRECVRHLWNTYFRERAGDGPDWQVRFHFDEIAGKVFAALVLYPLVVFDGCELPGSETKPLAFLHVVPASSGGAQIWVPRTTSHNLQEEHIVIRPRELDLRFISFFDFDSLGHRDFQYYQLRVLASQVHPDLVGRDAFLERQYAKVLFDETAVERG